MSWSSFYIQTLISIAIALVVLILTIIDIFPLRVLVGLVPILIFLAILRNSIDKRTNKDGIPTTTTYATKIYSYLAVLYNDVGLFVEQYYNFENSYNSQKSEFIYGKMKEFVPLMSRYKLEISDELEAEINVFFDTLCNYEKRVAGAVSYRRDVTAYNRWMEINKEFGETVPPMLKELEEKLKQY